MGWRMIICYVIFVNSHPQYYHRHFRQTLTMVHAVIGRQVHRICSPRIRGEARHPHVSHIPFKARGREQRIVYCRIVVQLVWFGGYERREFQGAAVGEVMRTFGASGAFYILVYLGSLLTVVYRRGCQCRYVSFGMCC